MAGLLAVIVKFVLDDAAPVYIVAVVVAEAAVPIPRLPVVDKPPALSIVTWSIVFAWFLNIKIIMFGVVGVLLLLGF